MSIVRVVKKNNYTVVSNNLAQNSNLSYEARGLMLYLLSKPDNWEVKVKNLMNSAPKGKKPTTGRDSIQRLLAELQKEGYAQLRSIPGENGQKMGRQWIIFEEPQVNGMGKESDKLNFSSSASPKAWNPDGRENRLSGKPTVGFSGHIKSTEVLQNKEGIKSTDHTQKELVRLKEQLKNLETENEVLRGRHSSTQTSQEKPPATTHVVNNAEAYQQFLELYRTVFPNLRNSTILESIWMGLPDEDIQAIQEHLPEYLQSNESRFLKNPRSYLQQKEYENPVVNRKKGHTRAFESDKAKAQINQFLSTLSDERPNQRTYTGC